MSDIIVGTPKKEQTAPVVIKPGGSVASAVIVDPPYIPPSPTYNPPTPYIPPITSPTYAPVDIIVGTPKIPPPPDAVVIPTPSTPVASIPPQGPLTDLTPPLAPDTTRQEELNSQNAKWEVDGVVYNTYAEAQAAAAPPPTTTTIPPPELITNNTGYFVDAPGMESYVTNLNIPTTQSGLYTRGWVDTQINEVSKELHTFGVALEKAAASTKLEGNNLAAGAQASAAIAVGVSAALFDTATFMLNPYDTDTVNVLDEFGENPLFATGYVGGEVAVVLYGAASIKEALKGKNLDDIKNWLDDADRFIDVNPQIKSPAKLIDPNKVYNENYTEAATTYPGSDVVAYPMVDSESLYVAAMTPLDLDIPLYYYPATHQISVTAAAALAALGVASVSNSLLSRNQAVINSVSTTLKTRDINEVLSRQVYAPRTLDEMIPLVEMRPISATETVQQLNQIADAIAAQESATAQITEQTPIQIPEQVPIQTPIQYPIMVVPVDTPVPVEEMPVEDVPQGLKPLKLPRGGKQYEKREYPHREAPRGGDYVVRFRYGRKTVVKTVDAKSFREALTKTITGHPSEVEVRRRG